MNILQYIWYKLREIDSMYYEVTAYIIITILICVVLVGLQVRYELFKNNIKY